MKRKAIIKVLRRHYMVLVERDPMWYGTRYNIYLYPERQKQRIVGWCFKKEIVRWVK